VRLLCLFSIYCYHIQMFDQRFSTFAYLKHLWHFFAINSNIVGLLTLVHHRELFKLRHRDGKIQICLKRSFFVNAKSSGRGYRSVVLTFSLKMKIN
jgi:hypothetical protein